MRISAIGREPLPLTAWSSLRVFLWYFGTQLVVGGLLGVFLGIWDAVGGEDAAAHIGDGTTRYLIPFAVIGMVVAALVMFRKARQRFPSGSWPTILAALGWRQAPPRDIVIGAVAGALLAAFYLLVLARLFPPHPGQSFGPLSQAAASASTSVRVLFALLAVFFAPPVEEFLFRGVLLTGFGNSWGVGPAAVIVTLLFAVGHMAEVRTYWPALLSISVLASVTMALRLRTRSLLPGIGMHASYNAALMATMFIGAN
ncbi:MAG TPA: CPBP family intramembrane glutamic endopeptidase [Gemmatimonadales bacterium]|jgi:membrane protease YdiL (CAAX protease family)